MDGKMMQMGIYGRPYQQGKQFFFELAGARFGSAVQYSDTALGP